MSKSSLSKIALPLAGLAVVLTAQTTSATDFEKKSPAFEDVLEAARIKDWPQTKRYAADMDVPVVETLAEWLELRDGVDDWHRYNAFLAEHSDWPGLLILRRSGEAAITSSAAPTAVVDFFEPQPPQTGNGAVRLAEAHLRLGQPRMAVDVIRDGWKSLPFSATAFAEAIQLFGEELSDVHAIRLNSLLWEQRELEAQTMIPLVSKGMGDLAKARIALQKNSNGVSVLISNIPNRLQENGGLAFDRVNWRLKRDFENTAIELLISVSQSKQSLDRPELWGARRLSASHALMRAGQYEDAYLVASRHFMDNDGELPSLDQISFAHRKSAEKSQRSDYAQLEWFSGYLQLRFLNNPQRALRHFHAFSQIVNTPISIGRAGYWLGLTYEALQDRKQAHREFARAALHQTTFYGQLATEHIGAETHPALTANDDRSDRRAEARLEKLPIVQAGLLYHYAGHDSKAAWFLAHVAETLEHEDIHSLSSLAFRHGAMFSAVKVAKEGIKRGVTDIEHLFPLVGIESFTLPVNPEVVLSVARQETEFRERAVSSAGAIGFMQIKPRTGRELADHIGLSGNILNLLRNREYNVLLGATYLDQHLTNYSGSLIMSFAAYNAGKGRIASWIGTIGDPRSAGVDPVDWIEHIPFSETRNYVMRVLEAMTVYRMRLDGQNRRISLYSDLIAG